MQYDFSHHYSHQSVCPVVNWEEVCTLECFPVCVCKAMKPAEVFKTFWLTVGWFMIWIVLLWWHCCILLLPQLWCLCNVLCR